MTKPFFKDTLTDVFYEACYHIFIKNDLTAISNIVFLRKIFINAHPTTPKPNILEATRGQTANGYAGDDRIEVTGANASVNGGAGDDSIISSGYLDVILGGGRDDDYIDYVPLVIKV